MAWPEGNETTSEQPTVEQAQARIKELMTKSPGMEAVQSEFTRLPLYLLGGGGIAYVGFDYALRKELIRAAKRPGLIKAGAFCIGSMLGVQIGFWRMKRLYDSADPDHRIRAEVSDLMKLIKERK